MSSAKQSLLRSIPAVEMLLNEPRIAAAAIGQPRRLATDCVRAAVDAMRQTILADDGARRGCAAKAVSDEAHLRELIVDDALRRLRTAAQPHYRKVINATGIILHTALGRAALPPRAMRQIQDELSGYSLLQAEVESGQRARRDDRIEELLIRLTGAEAATVVNNNAAATAIVLNTLGRGREIIVSRGQLVEIGGEFRLPEVMEAAGVKLIEVGSTNKTHARDYERAITEHTAAILRVHPSNYRIVGFTAEVALDELVRIAHAHNLPLIDDVGAGPLLDFARFGFEHETTLPESVAAGADVITASADKLIGGPQGGIILGRTTWIQKIRKNPLARVVRVDKLTLAALEATLSLFLDEDVALAEVPTLRLLRRRFAEIDEQALRIKAAIEARTDAAAVDVVDGHSQMGSGSLPTQDLPTRLVALAPRAISPDVLALRLRQQHPAVFARIKNDVLLIDPRTLLEGEEAMVVEAVACALGEG